MFVYAEVWTFQMLRQWIAAPQHTHLANQSLLPYQRSHQTLCGTRLCPRCLCADADTLQVVYEVHVGTVLFSGRSHMVLAIPMGHIV